MDNSTVARPAALPDREHELEFERVRAARRRQSVLGYPGPIFEDADAC